MNLISKSILGLSALAAIGAAVMVEPAFSARPKSDVPALTAQGKIASRLPGAAERPAEKAEAVARIRMAHGLTGASPEQTARQIASIDCRAFSWPDVPAECLTRSSNDAPRAVRVIARDVSASAKPIAASVTTQRATRN